MLRYVSGWLAALFLAAAVHAAPASESVDPNALLRTFNDAWEASDWETADEAGRQLTALRVFDAQADGLRYSVLARLGYAQYRLEQHDAALATWEQAETATDSPTFLNYWRFYLHLTREDWLDAYDAFVVMDDADLSSRHTIRVSAYYRVINGLKEDGIRHERADMLTRLVNSYEPEEMFVDLEPMRLRLARIAAEDGKPDVAMVMVRTFRLGSSRSTVRTEAVFSDLWSEPEFDEITDVVAGIHAELDQAREQMEAHPDHLEPLAQQTRLLLTLGRPVEAEAVARAAFERLESGEAFLDADDQTNWLLNEWAYSLYALGRLDEANATMQRGSALTEGSGANVSQLINLSSMLVYQGEDEAALELMSEMDDRNASPYGWMWVWHVRACASHGLGNEAARDEYMAQLAENWRDNPAAYQTALICTDRLDDAADLLVRRLADPVYASGALVALQDRQPLFADSGMTRSAEWSEALDQLATRPEVAAAVEAVGRIESQPLTDAYWGSF